MGLGGIYFQKPLDYWLDTLASLGKRVPPTLLGLSSLARMKLNYFTKPVNNNTHALAR